MKKKRLFMFVATLALLSAQLVFPSNGRAMSVASGGPFLSQEITVSAVDNTKSWPSVAYNSKHNEYLVVWDISWPSGTFDIRAQRVSAQGKLLGGEFIVYSDPTHLSSDASVAYDPVNDRYLVVFAYKDITDTDLYGRLIPWNGPSAGLTIFPIITWGSFQRNPKVIFAGGLQNQFVMVWENTVTSGSPKTYVSVKHINLDGTSLSGTADLSYSDASYHYIRPGITYNLARNEFLVVWEKFDVVNSDIWAARINGSNYHTTGSPFTVAGWPDNESHPGVDACNIANKYLVTWQSDVGTGGTDYAIYGYTINGITDANNGLDTVFQIDNTTLPETQPSVACSRSGEQFLVVYQQMKTNLKYGIRARMVYPDSSMDAAFNLVLPGLDRTQAAVASGSINFLVAWSHQRDVNNVDIHAKLVTRFKVFLPSILRP